MIIIIGKNYDKELIERYEDEIDRSKMLIDKSVIGALTFGKTTKLKNIDLYYISLISKELERMVDRLILLGEGNNKFLDGVTKSIEILQVILQDISKLDQELAMEFAKAVTSIRIPDIKDVQTYYMSSMLHHLTSISEVIIDWMGTLNLEN